METDETTGAAISRHSSHRLTSIAYALKPMGRHTVKMEGLPVPLRPPCKAWVVSNLPIRYSLYGRPDGTAVESGPPLV